MEKSWLKRIRSLQQKKYRKQEQLFLVEGRKNVLELLSSSWETIAVFGTSAFLEAEAVALQPYQSLLHEAKEVDLVKAGTFKSNQHALAVAKITKPVTYPVQEPAALTLALDDIQDPGNLGAIIRIADWYGVSHLLCSESTADVFNPKVINATMGSFARVHCHYVDLSVFLGKLPTEFHVYGANMEGQNLHETSFQMPAVLLLGNESKGIGEGLAKQVGTHVTIPKFGKAESLNVAMATAVFCDNFRQQYP